MNVIIARIGRHEVVKFAFTELEKYLKLIDEKSFIDARVYAERDSSKENIIWVGLDGSVPYSEKDSIRIDVKEGGGIITGSNERSVLLAVYRFLFELGIRWVRPGEDGEVIPKKKLERAILNVSVNETPSLKHRGICIEGQTSYEHISDIIDWLPKIGLNTYFVQFQTPACFFRRWYNEQESTEEIPVDPVDDEDVDHIWLRLEEEVTRRGLSYHAVGHSWTCEAFGVHGTEWRDDDINTLPEEYRNALALRDGKRELWDHPVGRSVLNTNLCYSNPKVRQRIIDEILRYCKKHPSVDYLHFWLADGYNNHCECDECRKYRPSDYYVILLNEIDEALNKAGFASKIVFLIYEDLLWEPEHFELKNPDRFTLMFAPISRSYRKAFADFSPEEATEVMPYVRNRLVMPTSVASNVAYLNRWQEKFCGDSFDFDYHLMWNHYSDPGYYFAAKIMHLDMKNLHKIGLNGMISCQLNRAFFPTALPNYAMAKALWDEKSDFEDVCREYYSAAFGEDGKEVDEYLHRLSDLFDLGTVTEDKDSERFIKNCNEAKELIRSYTEEKLKKNASVNPSWKYLLHHAEYCLAYADLAIAAAMHDEAEYKKQTESFKELVWRQRPYLHHVYDSRISDQIYEVYLKNL